MRAAHVRWVAVTAAATVVTTGLLGGAGPASAASFFPTQLLDQLMVAAESNSPAYDRSYFEHWVDADGDGCHTRAEILIAESTVPAIVGPGCDVTAGSWTSYYDGALWTDPSDVDIDHLVALAEAWQSGASAWDPAQRRAFANDLDFGAELAAVTDDVNQVKGSRDYAEWAPTAQGAGCRYAIEWVQVKYRWNLTVDPTEQEALARFLPSCGSAPIDVPARADVPAPVPSADGDETIVGGQQLRGGESLRSSDGRYELVLQGDGNLVAYAPGGRVLFSSDTWGNAGAVFTMQADGNAVVYARDGRPLWDTGTWRDPGARLTVQDDGNVVLYRADDSAAWSTGWDRSGLRPGDELTPGQRVTSPNGRYHVTLQRDGNTVVYESSTGRPLYSAGSYGAALLRMQDDGNLVAYRGNGAPAGSTGTWREGRSRVDVQDDGNLVVYRADGSPSWRSGWDAGQWATSPSPGTYLPRPTNPISPTPPGPPGNPGDSRNCGDFTTWRAAQDWFDTYYPYYGDVARLDGDEDRIACEKLPGHP